MKSYPKLRDTFPLPPEKVDADFYKSKIAQARTFEGLEIIRASAMADESLGGDEKDELAQLCAERKVTLKGILKAKRFWERKVATMAILALGFIGFSAHAGIPTAQAVAAIIGEAGGESYATQVAVACAIRNRGTLQGVYGVSNPVVKQASAKTIARARAAWAASARKDVVRGCKYFGCKADAPKLISYGLHAVCMSGAITFYTSI